MSSVKSGEQPIIVVAGVGNGTGTGAATARAFAGAGYRVALIARNANHLEATAEAIIKAGGEAVPFPLAVYDAKSFESTFASIKSQWPSGTLRAAVFNVGLGFFKPFLDTTDEEVAQSLDVNVRAAFAFARNAILAFRANEGLDENGKRGTLIFTGATASLRGNTITSAFSAGKFGLRALSQSLNKEFGKENIHVAHAIIDGGIINDHSRELQNDPEWEKNEAARLNPESIAKVSYSTV